MSAVIEWQDPPADGRGRRSSAQWTAIADALRSKPGTWALVLESTPSGSSIQRRIRLGKMQHFAPAGSFEATTRRVSTGPNRYDLYVRYVGEARS